MAVCHGAAGARIFLFHSTSRRTSCAWVTHEGGSFSCCAAAPGSTILTTPARPCGTATTRTTSTPTLAYGPAVSLPQHPSPSEPLEGIPTGAHGGSQAPASAAGTRCAPPSAGQPTGKAPGHGIRCPRWPHSGAALPAGGNPEELPLGAWLSPLNALRTRPAGRQAA
jgi:hypothetical protein